MNKQQSLYLLPSSMLLFCLRLAFCFAFCLSIGTPLPAIVFATNRQGSLSMKSSLNWSTNPTHKKQPNNNQFNQNQYH